MEVFLRNLPPHLGDAALQGLLHPFMEQLSITDYRAEKQRNKRIGQITFLNAADGKRFLQQHGEEPLPNNHLGGFAQRRNHAHPPTKARLSLMRTAIYCKLSEREPHELTLKSIEHAANQRQSHHDAPPVEHVKTLQASELNCGYHTFVDRRLTFTAEWTAHETCLVKFSKRNLIIDMSRRRVQLRIPFSSIFELVWWQNGNVALTLSWAPTILGPSANSADDLASMLSTLKINQTGQDRQAGQRQRLEAIDSQHRTISEYCVVYHFKVPTAITRQANADFHSEISRMGKKELFFVTRYDLGFQHAATSRFPHFSTAVVSLKDQLANYNTTDSLPFGLLFLLQALLTNGYLHPSTISDLARKLARDFAGTKKARNGQPPVSVEAFKKLFQWIDYPSPNGDPTVFEADGIMDYLREAEKLVSEGHAVRSKLFNETQSRARVFRAVITPSRVMLHGPELEPMNRVLRKFPDHSYFIRAQFCDENGHDLFFSPKISLDAIYNRFKSVLSGIPVGGRVYKLLGFSHSSLRAHSAWLSAPFVHDSQLHFPESIIRGLGDFGGIRSTARRAARIGQAFSETPYEVNLDEHNIHVVEIKDVERNSRVFSDGVGTISPGAVEAVYSVIPESKGYPTCFQIRRAGAKGMLALDPRLEGNIICIRPSMSKFESEDKNLEICDMASKPMPMVLNRQLIKILEDMGAPAKWFLDLEAKEVKRLRGITATVYNTATFLRSQTIGEAVKLHKFLRQTEIMGIDYRRDAFLRGAVEAVLLRELRLLKHKARIPVEKGMTLFGIMDETGYLNEGEVYVAYDAVEGRDCEPPGEGRVIVTRSPALHPGDVQTAWNKIPPDGHPLLQLRNCLVFSMWGDRDLPSQLSGGDLDGDVFHVIFDEEVVDRVRTVKAADYARVKPLELDREVELADMAAFFVDFMKTDHLGVIATRHMILADQRVDGTRDSDCIKLAEFHSSAVDFSKSGLAVELKTIPRGGKWRPDFFAQGPSITIHDKSAVTLDQHVAHQDNEDDEDNEEGPRHQFYKSDKILGQLYRAVDEQKIWAEDIRMAVGVRGPSFWDQLLAGLSQRVSEIGPVEWQHREAEAHRIRHAYEDAVHGLTIDCAEHPHQPLRELEVFIGFIINKTGIQTRRQRDRSVKLKDEFERITTWIMGEIRNPTSISGYTSELDRLELCFACFNVGCLKENRGWHAGHRSSAQDIESFKIVAATALMRELSTLERRTVV